MKYYELLVKISQRLTGYGVDHSEAVAEARLIAAHLLLIPLSHLPLHIQEEVQQTQLVRLEEILARREKHEPLQYIIGSWEFMGLDIRVRPGVLIPRGDSECIVEQILADQPKEATLTIADICCGSGAYGIALAHFLPRATVKAVDISPTAVALTQENIRLQGITDRMQVYQGDLLTPLQEQKAAFDLIVANPPYIPTAVIETLSLEVQQEPLLALDGGADGLILYPRLADQAYPLLKPGGRIYLEHGDEQSEAVSRILEQTGYRDIRPIRDYGGRMRGLSACIR